MKFVPIFICVVLFFPLLARTDSTVMIENFDSYKAGPIPETGWRFRNGDPAGIYEILMEPSGNKFLHAKDTGQTVQVFRKQEWKIKDYPILSWRWRAKQLPKRADERENKTNDSAAGVYVVFPMRYFIPEAIKYVWSTSAPVGTKVVRKDRFPIYVIRSGTEKMGNWVTEERNVFEDYKTHFSRVPANPVAVGFLTDANEVKGVAEGDYDDVIAKTK